MQQIANIKTGNINIQNISSYPINNYFSFQNNNPIFPLIFTENPFQTFKSFGSGNNAEEYTTNFNIGNEDS